MSSGDRVADEIFSALETNKAGLTKTEINNLFNRNRTAKEIEAALQTLLELERIEKVEEKTLGRPREVFKVLRYEINELNEKSPSQNQNHELNLFNSFNSFISSAEIKNETPEKETCPTCKCEFDQTPNGQIFCPICLDSK